MANLATRIGIGLLPLFLLAACESEEEKAARLEQAQEIVETSLERCDLQEEFAQSVSYEERLTSVLSDVSKSTLDEIENAEATVCLDHRLAEIDNDYGSSGQPEALYYPEQRLLSLSTDGENSSYGDNLLGRFFDNYNVTEISDIDEVKIGTTYTYVTIVNKVPITNRGYRWNDDAQDYQALKDNPELLTPPLAE